MSSFEQALDAVVDLAQEIDTSNDPIRRLRALAGGRGASGAGLYDQVLRGCARATLAELTEPVTKELSRLVMVAQDRATGTGDPARAEVWRLVIFTIQDFIACHYPTSLAELSNKLKKSFWFDPKDQDDYLLFIGIYATIRNLGLELEDAPKEPPANDLEGAVQTSQAANSK